MGAIKREHVHPQNHDMHLSVVMHSFGSNFVEVRLDDDYERWPLFIVLELN